MCSEHTSLGAPGPGPLRPPSQPRRKCEQALGRWPRIRTTRGPQHHPEPAAGPGRRAAAGVVVCGDDRGARQHVPRLGDAGAARAPRAGGSLAGHGRGAHRRRAHGPAAARSRLAPEPPALRPVRAGAQRARSRAVEVAIDGRSGDSFLGIGRHRPHGFLPAAADQRQRRGHPRARAGMGLRARPQRTAGVQRRRGPGGAERAPAAVPAAALYLVRRARAAVAGRARRAAAARAQAAAAAGAGDRGGRRWPPGAARRRLSARAGRRRRFAQCAAGLGAAAHQALPRHARQPRAQPEDAAGCHARQRWAPGRSRARR